MKARAVLAACLAASSVPSVAGPLVLTHPADRFSATRFEVEYLRPWAGLPVQQGRLAASLPLGARSAVGVEWTGTGSPTTDRAVLGVVVRLGGVVRAEGGVRQLRVSGFEVWRDPVGRVDLRVGAGDFGFGVSAAWEPAAAAQRPALLRRQVWLSVRHAAGDLVLARRVVPWQAEPSWSAALRLQLADSARLAARFGPAGIVLALEWVGGPLVITSSAQCTGARAGAFALRLAESR